MELPKTSFDELPSPTSDLAWSPSPRSGGCRPRLPRHCRARIGEELRRSPQRRRDAALELELGAPDGQGGRIGERLRSGATTAAAPSGAETPQGRSTATAESRAFANQGKCPGRHYGAEEGPRRLNIDKKIEGTQGPEQYARLDSTPSSRKLKLGPAPSLVRRPETPATLRKSRTALQMSSGGR